MTIATGVFMMGLICGASLGVFSLLTLEIPVCAIAFVIGWSEGIASALGTALTHGAVLMAGFLVSFVCLSLMSKTGVQPSPSSAWRRNSVSSDRFTRGFQHGDFNRLR